MLKIIRIEVPYEIINICGEYDKFYNRLNNIKTHNTEFPVVPSGRTIWTRIKLRKRSNTKD